MALKKMQFQFYKEGLSEVSEGVTEMFSKVLEGDCPGLRWFPSAMHDLPCP